MQEDSKTAGYGWNSDLGPQSCDYLGPPSWRNWPVDRRDPCWILGAKTVHC